MACFSLTDGVQNYTALVALGFLCADGTPLLWADNTLSFVSF